jgi:hypothetical protein
VNKKQKQKNELEVELNREHDKGDCPMCGQRFNNCALLRDAHRKRYPSHFV